MRFALISEKSSQMLVQLSQIFIQWNFCFFVAEHAKKLWRERWPRDWYPILKEKMLQNEYFKMHKNQKQTENSKKNSRNSNKLKQKSQTKMPKKRILQKTKNQKNSTKLKQNLKINQKNQKKSNKDQTKIKQKRQKMNTSKHLKLK